ncbi:hypothetical protein [Lysinibacillus sp. Bpr_S20]|uniref:hypothetical protein n=1 Tax=Lysinibacillus sp. Bpr_S20 TaxID=2933964 RepID=UPI00201184DB|nr:hypothetical protein [Lysinibacillus sp. Bpr_S20]MCL1701605.1 hypothetical protein [Lysinibacillus sp. Bpr_S20]
MDIKKEFININISKKNSEIVLLLSAAVLSEIILDKEAYYTKNPDLKSFTVEILEKDYGEYLFNARPALFARSVKDLREHQKKDIEQFLKIAKNIQKFLVNNVEKDKNDKNKPNNDKEKKSNSNKNVIDAWRAVIES